MKLVNKLLHIIAMSMERDRLIDKLSDNKALKFAQHCGDIVLFGLTQDLAHWSGELWGLCEWIQDTTIKPNNKPVDYDLIMEYFFGYDDGLSTYSNMLDRIYLDKKNSLRKDKSKDTIYFNNYRAFCNEVALNLSKQILNKNILLELIKKYLINEEK